MTWNELKEHIDREIKDQGKDGEIQVWYIDIDFPVDIDPPTVDVSEGLRVS